MNYFKLFIAAAIAYAIQGIIVIYLSLHNYPDKPSYLWVLTMAGNFLIMCFFDYKINESKYLPKNI